MHRFLILWFCLFWVSSSFAQQVWVPDQGDGTYKNPIIYADYSDPDVCQAGDDFYMTSSSFNAIPGLPILHSKDLVNWTIINHALQPNVDAHFDILQHGNGVWAPSFRYHEGMFYIYWGDPDRGIFMVKTADPAGKWSAPILVKKAYGNIDPCPLWDEDGNVYLVHAFAHSRAGINSTLQVVKLTPEGDKILDKGTIVVDGHGTHPTLEGPKFYKRNGYYYIFAPAGGVPAGWQEVFRSKNVYGPYESRRVLEQGDTPINGPHQGGLINLENGESWFIHFQDREEYGRIVHLQPVKWIDDWPVMGTDADGDGTGYPVLSYQKPSLSGKTELKVPQTSDEFDDEKLGLQWQWNANPKPNWYELKSGKLRLQAIPKKGINLWTAPHVLTQKLPAPAFEALTKVDISGLRDREETGLFLFGLDYGGLFIQKRNGKVSIGVKTCKDADEGRSETNTEVQDIQEISNIWLKAIVRDGEATYAYSLNGKKYKTFSTAFSIREGKWVGAKLALYCSREKATGMHGFASFDWFRVMLINE